LNFGREQLPSSGVPQFLLIFKLQSILSHHKRFLILPFRKDSMFNDMLKLQDSDSFGKFRFHLFAEKGTIFEITNSWHYSGR